MGRDPSDHQRVVPGTPHRPGGWGGWENDHFPPRVGEFHRGAFLHRGPAERRTEGGDTCRAIRPPVNERWLPGASQPPTLWGAGGGSGGSQAVGFAV